MKCSKDNFIRFYNLVDNGLLSNRKAAKACGYSESRFCELRNRYKQEGAKIFIHGHCGKPAYNRIKKETRLFIYDKYIEESTLNSYSLNFKYFAEIIREEYGIHISNRAVYDILKSYGLASPEAHNVKRKEVHRIRFRKDCEGELLQLDATPYQWNLWNGDKNYYAAHGSIDDATSKITGMYICENECRYGYIECRRQTIKNFGVEIADYTDKASIFSNNNLVLSVDEQLIGLSKKQLDWNRMNEELSIRQILANSPQAKGKIERAWETIQSHLPRFFRMYKADTLDKMNVVIQEYFIPYYNKHFAKKPKIETPVFRSFSNKDGLTLENILCVKEKHHVMNSGCIRTNGLEFRIKDFPHRNVNGELCINERGLWFLYNKKRYEIELQTDGKYGEVYRDRMPQVLQAIIHKYMYKDCKLSACA